MRHSSSALVVAAALSFGAGTAGAQACVGLPSGAVANAFVGFEGTDGRTGTSHMLALQHERVGLQLERERSRRTIGLRMAWEANATYRLGASPAARTALCAVGGVSHMSDRLYADSHLEIDPAVDPIAKYRRLRVPLGLSLGHEIMVERYALSVMPFVQPTLLLQRERLFNEDAPDRGETHTRGAFAGTVGLGMSVRPVSVRASVSYATLPKESLARDHNWMVLSLQMGIGF